MARATCWTTMMILCFGCSSATKPVVKQTPAISVSEDVAQVTFYLAKMNQQLQIL